MGIADKFAILAAALSGGRYKKASRYFFGRLFDPEEMAPEMQKNTVIRIEDLKPLPAPKMPEKPVKYKMLFIGPREDKTKVITTDDIKPAKRIEVKPAKKTELKPAKRTEIRAAGKESKKQKLARLRQTLRELEARLKTKPDKNGQ